jgi:hypothetical protein
MESKEEHDPITVFSQMIPNISLLIVLRKTSAGVIVFMRFFSQVDMNTL